MPETTAMSSIIESFTRLRISGRDEHDEANPTLFTGLPIPPEAFGPKDRPGWDGLPGEPKPCIQPRSARLANLVGSLPDGSFGVMAMLSLPPHDGERFAYQPSNELKRALTVRMGCRLERVYAKPREDQTLYELYRIATCPHLPMT